MITASITEVKARLSEFIRLCEEENEIIFVTKRGKPVAALVAPAKLESLLTDSEKPNGLDSVDEAFACQLDDFINQYRPGLKALSKA